jgi:hypothetical protein
MNTLNYSNGSLRNFGAALLLGCSAFAAVAQTAGTVTVYHLNANAGDRGACVQMVPALPEVPWACVWKSNNPLFDEMNSMLLTASNGAKNCRLWLDSKDVNGAWLLRMAECN